MSAEPPTGKMCTVGLAGVRHISVCCGGQWTPEVVMTTFLAKEAGQGEGAGQTSTSDGMGGVAGAGAAAVAAVAGENGRKK